MTLTDFIEIWVEFYASLLEKWEDYIRGLWQTGK
jgi:hypothetical protein